MANGCYGGNVSNYFTGISTTFDSRANYKNGLDKPMDKYQLSKQSNTLPNIIEQTYLGKNPLRYVSNTTLNQDLTPGKEIFSSPNPVIIEKYGFRIRDSKPPIYQF
jgi:hypothetical protein